jgi:hypothetical protein
MTSSDSRGAPRRFGVGRIAIRQLRSRATLAVAQGLTLAAAATLVASVVLIQDQATDNGLRSAIAASAGGANVFVERDGISTAAVFDAFQRDATARVHADLGDAVTAAARFGRSATQVVRTIDGVSQGPPITWNPSLMFYDGLRDHVRVVAGQWPADSRSGHAWLITMSARATDDLGTPLHVRVGQVYCFSPSSARGTVPPAWCGRVAATWLPVDDADPYWAGHIPETDVATGHDSFFQVLTTFRGSSNGAEQQYTPDVAHITAAAAAGVVGGVNQLRGYYSVSSNDVFVSGLDTTITAFLARQNAAAGPSLVSAIGLLVVAVAAMGFAALQFIQGHAGQAALWRVRGWSRRRVWTLCTLEFAVLALVATPLAILASSLIVSLAAGTSGARRGWGWQPIGDATVPAIIAAAAFLVILAALAGLFTDPALSQRRRARAAGGRRGRRRLAGFASFVAGAAILVFVHTGGADAAGPDGQGNDVVLALPVLAVGLLAYASVRLVGIVARVLTVTRSLGGRLARWQLERDPAQYSRLCLLVTLAVAVGVFASTWTAADRASAIDRADYAVGADVQATFSAAASPPQLDSLTASLPRAVAAAEVFRGAGRPGRSGTDATVIGIQGSDFWQVAYSRNDFATRPLPILTSRMTAADPDGKPVPGRPHSLTVSIYDSGFAARVDLEVSDASDRRALLTMGTISAPGWTDLTASLTASPVPLTYPVRVRSLRVVPTGLGSGDVAVQNLRTDAGTVVESFAAADGWWQETFAPDTAQAPLTPSALHTRNGSASVDVSVDLQAVILQPAPSSRPLPVLLATQTLADLGLSIGQSFPLHIDTVDIELVAVGSFDLFPTFYPTLEPLIVVPETSFLGRLGHEGGTSPWPDELWLSVPGAAAAPVQAALAADSTLLTSLRRNDAESQALNDPLRVGLQDELGLGFIVALAVVVIGFGLHFLAAARSRVTQFAIMRANGVPEATLRNSQLAEQVVVLLTGLASGLAIGLAAAWAVLPIFNLGILPADVTPASIFHVDLPTLAGVVLGTGALALAVGRGVAGVASRVDVMSTVRSLT